MKVEQDNVWNGIIIKNNDEIRKKNSRNYFRGIGCERSFTINHFEARSMKKSSVGVLKFYYLFLYIFMGFSFFPGEDARNKILGSALPCSQLMLCTRHLPFYLKQHICFLFFLELFPTQPAYIFMLLMLLKKRRRVCVIIEGDLEHKGQRNHSHISNWPYLCPINNLSASLARFALEVTLKAILPIMRCEWVISVL